jgi:hypothetical protein
MKKILTATCLCLGLGACTTPTQYQWTKPGGTIQERDQCLAAARVEALQAYPNPMSAEQVHSESIAAPLMRKAYREEIIINSMAAQGWSLTPKTPTQ